MIPSYDEDLSVDYDEEDEPSYTYAMNLTDGEIVGNCDDISAMAQAVYKILHTERYENIIYSWDYGVELNDLFGRPKHYVIPEIERRFTEALLADDRIDSVGGFEFKEGKGRSLAVSFNVHTVFGDVEEEMEVQY